MPEGPSIIILKEAVRMFKGKRILSVAGNTSVDKDRLINQKVIELKSWGKHFLICFTGFTVRIHFMLFGSYQHKRTNQKSAPASLAFQQWRSVLLCLFHKIH